MTSYAEVIGDPISQSKSPIIHNFWLKALGIEGDYRATRVTRDGLADFVRNRRGDSRQAQGTRRGRLGLARAPLGSAWVLR